MSASELSFLLGLVIGTAVGAFVVGALATAGRADRETAAFLRGRNYERAARGEDTLEPAPELRAIEDGDDEQQLWQYGA